MNKLQRELYNKVKAMGPDGLYIVEVIREYPRIGGSRRTSSKVTGQRECNTMMSMLPPEGWAAHLPGGYRREIKFVLVEERKIDKIFYDKNNPVAQVVSEQYFIKLIEFN